jgi:hypothetical protein
MLLFLAAILSGPRLIWLVNKGSWLVVSRQVNPLPCRSILISQHNWFQAPPLGTIWTYTIIQLNLMPAVASLVVVFSSAKLMNWKLVF